MWQDSLLSLAFGRLSSCYEMDFEEDLPSLQRAERTGGLSYRGSMNWLCHIAARHLAARPAAMPPPGLLPICREIDSLDSFLSPHLKDRQSCVTIQDIQEHYAFELHRNFSISTICRPYVSERDVSGREESDRAEILARLCSALKRSAEAYLNLRTLSSYARRSWAFVHNGLASVLLLSLMKETRDSGETRLLQKRMIESLEQEAPFGTDPGSTQADRLSDTHEKALKAIKALKRLSELEVDAAVTPQMGAAETGHVPVRSDPTQPANVPDLAFMPSL